MDEIILGILNRHTELVCNIKKKINDTISLSRAEYNAEIKKIRIVEKDKKLEKYRSLLNEPLKDNKCDFISEKDYEDFKQKYLYEINKLNIEKDNLKINKINSYDFEWLNKLEKIGIIESVNRNIVDSFIKNIFVDNEKGVDIIYRYSDHYKLTERYLKKQNDVV